MSILTYEQILIDTDSCTVAYDGEIVILHPLEYRLLVLFLQHPHHVLNYGAIAENLWDEDRLPTESTIRSHIKGLRKALKKAGVPDDIIQTVHSLGYRLKAEAEYSQPRNSELNLSALTLKKFLKAKNIEYLVLDKNLEIKWMSPGVMAYSDYPDALEVGKQAKEAFPEFIGLEETFEKILNHEESSFEIDGIEKAANPNRHDYINFYVLAENSDYEKKFSSEEEHLLIFFEDQSDAMFLKQQLLQQKGANFLN